MMKKTGGLLMVSLLVMMMLAVSGCGRKELTVGKDVKIEDVDEFYFTYDSSAYPPYFERYHFFVKDGKHYFRHEVREGDHWPLTEDDATVNETKELGEEAFQEFFSFLEGGKVRSRDEDAVDGDSGPWTYLYHKKDKGDVQEFSFVSYERRLEFEDFCRRLSAD